MRKARKTFIFEDAVVKLMDETMPEKNLIWIKTNSKLYYKLPIRRFFV